MSLRFLAEKSAPRRPGYGHFLSWTSSKESSFNSQRNHAELNMFNHIPFISSSSNAHDQMNLQTLKHRKCAPEDSSLMFISTSNVVDMETIYTAERRRRRTGRIISNNIINEMKFSNSFMTGQKRFYKPSELYPILHGSGNLYVRPYSQSVEEVVVVTNENEDSDIGTLGANQTGEIKIARASASDGLANSDDAIGSISKTKEMAEKLSTINDSKVLDSEEGMCIRSAMDSTNQMTEKIATENGSDGMVEKLATTNNAVSSSEVADLNGTQSSPMTNSIGSLPATKAGQKPRIVVLGTGWAASRLMKDLNTKMCDIVCVSPRNHMVFTPLLASTCVGTLEFRSVAEPIVRIQPALSESPDSFFFLGRCLSIDPQNHEIRCIAEGKDAVDPSCKDFTIAYDKLVIAAGAQALTFNIHGVAEHAIFLREVTDAQKIRKKLLLNLMLSDIPGTSEAEKRRLLHCVVVGGGPTGVEFSGELSDFIRSDVHQRYSHVKDYINVTLIEAKEILSSFDVRLRIYAIKHLEKAGVKLVQGVVKDVQPKEILLSDGSVVPYGLLVWSTGVGPSGFVKSLQLPKSRVGRIGVDEKLRVSGLEDVYAIGDCAGFVESVGKPDLPALAQVAERQGKYLARELNRILKAGGGQAGAAGSLLEEGPPFVYRHLGSMASVGRYKALVDLRENKVTSVLKLL